MTNPKTCHAEATQNNMQRYEEQQGMFTSHSPQVPQPFLLLNHPQLPHFLGCVIQQRRTCGKVSQRRRLADINVGECSYRRRISPTSASNVRQFTTNNQPRFVDNNQPRPLEIKHQGRFTVPFLLLNQPQVSQFLRLEGQESCVLGETSQSQRPSHNTNWDYSYRRRGRPRLTPSNEAPQVTSRRVRSRLGSVNQLQLLKNDQPQPMETTAASDILDKDSKDMEEDDTSTSSGHSSMECIDVDDEIMDDHSSSLVKDPKTGSIKKFFEPWNFGGPSKLCQFCSAVVWFSAGCNSFFMLYNSVQSLFQQQ